MMRVALLLLLLTGCGREAPPPPGPAADEPAAPPGAAFVDVAAASGLGFRHFNGAAGRRYDPEIMGSGAALFDYDGDGDLDALLLNGAPLPGTPTPAEAPRNRLFRNDGSGRFEDVTDAAGLGHPGFGMGLAVGDLDNDGDADLLVTNYGPDVLYRNNGDGTFEDVSAATGLDDARWTTSAAFLDYDADGDLDVYVAAYLDFDPATHKPCTVRELEVYCGPHHFNGLADRLYRNDGAWRFADVSRAEGLAAAGKGLGVVAGDFDADGDTDVYVANDGVANFLLVNQGPSGRPRFSEEALLRGVAYGESARAEAGMGVDMQDVDGDGDVDVVVTNLDNETNALYRNDDGFFMETSFASGLGATTLPWVGFGVALLDYDLDADPDLFVTNGHIIDNVARLRPGSRFEQPNLLFDNHEGRFTPACDGCLPDGIGRGLATGDVDGDGDADVLVTNNGAAPYLFRNVLAVRGPVVGLRLEGAPPGSNRDAYGARVSWSFGGRQRVREVRAAASYCSSHDPRLLLPVDEDVVRAAVTVRWPDGSEEVVELAPGAYHHVVQGRGRTAGTPFRPGR